MSSNSSGVDALPDDSWPEGFETYTAGPTLLAFGRGRTGRVVVTRMDRTSELHGEPLDKHTSPVLDEKFYRERADVVLRAFANARRLRGARKQVEGNVEVATTDPGALLVVILGMAEELAGVYRRQRERLESQKCAS